MLRKVAYTSPVANALSGVSNIYSNNDAFAAVLSDGSVVTWGDPESGGTNWDLDGLSESSTMTAGGNLTLGGALTQEVLPHLVSLKKLLLLVPVMILFVLLRFLEKTRLVVTFQKQ